MHAVSQSEKNHYSTHNQYTVISLILAVNKYLLLHSESMKNNINEKRDAVSKMFGGIAHRYDLMNTLMSLGMHKKWSNHAARVATIGLEGAALDVGTGTGDLAFAMANQRGINSVVGMDISPQMISKTKLKLKIKVFINNLQLKNDKYYL